MGQDYDDNEDIYKRIKANKKNKKKKQSEERMAQFEEDLEENEYNIDPRFVHKMKTRK